MWLQQVKRSHPHIYEKCKPITGEMISMADLVKVDTAIDPYISITWTKSDVIKGYKIHDGLRYDLKECMITYDRQRVFKYLYKQIYILQNKDLNISPHNNIFK
jgi:hypothetical protein